MGRRRSRCAAWRHSNRGWWLRDTSIRCGERTCGRRSSGPPRSTEGARSLKFQRLMIATYASAALICAVSLLVGRAILSLAGRAEWTWREPAVGLGAVLTATGLMARAPGHGKSSTLALAALIVLAALVL